MTFRHDDSGCNELAQHGLHRIGREVDDRPCYQHECGYTFVGHDELALDIFRCPQCTPREGDLVRFTRDGMKYSGTIPRDGIAGRTNGIRVIVPDYGSFLMPHDQVKKVL